MVGRYSHAPVCRVGWRFLFGDDMALLVRKNQGNNKVLRFSIALKKFPIRSTLRKAAKAQIKSIRDRTIIEQRDINGIPFKPLAALTQRASSPRPRPGARKLAQSIRGGINVLTEATSAFGGSGLGSMLKNMVSRVEGNMFRIFFKTDKADLKAHIHNQGTGTVERIAKKRFMRIPIPSANRGRGLFRKRVATSTPRREFFGYANYGGRRDAEMLESIFIDDVYDKISKAHL